MVLAAVNKACNRVVDMLSAPKAVHAHVTMWMGGDLHTDLEDGEGPQDCTRALSNHIMVNTCAQPAMQDKKHMCW
jgi:hypothetical protein